MSSQYTGTITRYELSEFESFSRSYNGFSNVNLCFNVELTCTDGSKVWFYTPTITQTTALGPGFCIVNIDSSKPYVWSNIEKSGFVTDKANQDLLHPTFAIGDTITVSGRIKKQYGKKGVSINYVKLIK